MNFMCRPKNQFNHRVRDLGQSKLEIQCDKPTITGISQNTTLHVDESIQLDCQIDNTSMFKFHYSHLTFLLFFNCIVSSSCLTYIITKLVRLTGEPVEGGETKPIQLEL